MGASSVAASALASHVSSMMLRWATLSLLFALIAAALASTPEDAAWLEANKENEGVVVLPSGLQYKVLNSGDPSGPIAGTEHAMQGALPRHPHQRRGVR